MFGNINFALNRFTGTIPDNLGSLKNLYLFEVGVNQLEARDVAHWNFLTSLTNCTRLTHLGISDNELQGVLPNSIANLSTDLEWLEMIGNQISGNIPVRIENLVGLTFLGMGQNHFTGTIPTALGKLHSLGSLILANNGLSGEIPSVLGNLTRLSELQLQHNDLWGSIPTSFGNYQQLNLLDLSYNNLSGIIPDQIFNLSSLTKYLNLSYNSFFGSLPTKMGRLSNLGELCLSANKLSGEISSTLGDCLSLDHLFLSDNLFRGIIPPSFINLKGIQELDLSLNNMTGRIPEFLGDFQFLDYLNLSFNNFEGEVPKNGKFTNVSAISLIGNNKLCGGISRLYLTACPVHQVYKKRESSRSLRVIIPIVIVCSCLFLFLLFIGVWYWMRKSKERQPQPMSSSDDKYVRISYNQLFKATDEFSSNNLIGMGSFGSVYKGTLEGHDTTVVAVKVLNLQRRGTLRSFMAECEALRNIRHRNLVKIITSCSSVDFRGNDFKALIFEFMPNGSLEKWLHPEVDAHGLFMRNLHFVQRLSIVIDIASALDYLHSHCHSPIVHCDLKPSNVLLDDDMNARVGDFGLARFLCEVTRKDSKNSANSIEIKGSVGYVAPEYGLGGSVSTYGDTYSFGILLLEMFTAKKPIDDMFKDGLSLRKLVETSLPEQVMDVVDPRLFSQDEENEASRGDPNGSGPSKRKMQLCLASVMRIGLMCTKESPRERMEMEDVVAEMQTIKGFYLGIARSATP